MYERTDNQIKYHMHVTGPQGARFELFPVVGRNTKEQVQSSIAQLKREQDVVKITTEWIDEDKWKTMKLFFHHSAEENDFLNKKYHELYHKLY